MVSPYFGAKLHPRTNQARQCNDGVLVSVLSSEIMVIIEWLIAYPPEDVEGSILRTLRIPDIARYCGDQQDHAEGQPQVPER